MLVVVDILIKGNQRPPEGAPIRVEIRDTSLMDAPSHTVGMAESKVQAAAGTLLGVVTVEAPAPCRNCQVWVHVDVDGDNRVSPGDFVTTAAYPIPASEQPRVIVSVQKV